MKEEAYDKYGKTVAKLRGIPGRGVGYTICLTYHGLARHMQLPYCGSLGKIFRPHSKAAM
jgi:hypothetical protein